MDIETIAQQLEEIRRRTRIRTVDDPARSRKDPALAEALQELDVAFEELRVAGEELTRQEEQIGALRESIFSERNRYHDLFESAPDGYLVTDPYGRIGDANRTAAEMLNVSQEILAGKPMSSFICPVTRGRFRHELDLLKSIDRDRELMVLMQPRDRESIQCTLRSSVARDRNGRAVAVRWLVRDLDHRHDSDGERELSEMIEQQINSHVASELLVSELMRELEEHVWIEGSLMENGNIYRAIIENGIDGTVIARADGTILFASAATFRILGVHPVDAIGWNIFDQVHRHDRDATAELLNRLLSWPGSEVTASVRIRHADRQWKRLAVRAINQIGMPHIDGIIIYFRSADEPAAGLCPE